MWNQMELVSHAACLILYWTSCRYCCWHILNYHHHSFSKLVKKLVKVKKLILDKEGVAELGSP